MAGKRRLAHGIVLEAPCRLNTRISLQARPSSPTFCAVHSIASPFSDSSGTARTSPYLSARSQCSLSAVHAVAVARLGSELGLKGEPKVKQMVPAQCSRLVSANSLNSPCALPTPDAQCVAQTPVAALPDKAGLGVGGSQQEPPGPVKEERADVGGLLLGRVDQRLDGRILQPAVESETWLLGYHTPLLRLSSNMTAQEHPPPSTPGTHRFWSKIKRLEV